MKWCDVFTTLHFNRSHSAQAQLKHCTTLLSSSDFHEVYLHSIGNAITRAINLALTLVADSNGGLGYEANTSTIELTDNLHPLHDDADFSVTRRLNGCLHVRIFRHCRDVLMLDDELPPAGELATTATADGSGDDSLLPPTQQQQHN